MFLPSNTPKKTPNKVLLRMFYSTIQDGSMSPIHKMEDEENLRVSNVHAATIAVINGGTSTLSLSCTKMEDQRNPNAINVDASTS